MNCCTAGRVFATSRCGEPTRHQLRRTFPTLEPRIWDGRGVHVGEGILTKLWSVALAAILVLLGCSATPIESQYFGSSYAIESAIKRHYARSATERNCYYPTIDGFTRVTVLEDTPSRLVVHARYLYRDFIQEGGDDDGRSTGRCTGYGERTFTLRRDPETGEVAVSMSGEQEEPALRVLLRRLFGG